MKTMITIQQNEKPKETKNKKHKVSDPIYLHVIYEVGVRSTRTKTKKEKLNSMYSKYKKEIRNYNY